MFQFISGGYYISNKYKKTKHIINHYELELCIVGDCKRIYENQTYELVRGSILFAKPSALPSYSTGNFESHHIHFLCDDADFIEKYINPLPYQIFNADTYKFTQLFKDIYMLHQNVEADYNEATQLLLQTKITTLILELYMIVQSLQTSQESNKHIACISNACQYINEHFKEAIGIEDISRAAAFSPSFTYLMFKRIMNMTPHEFLLNKRIQYACDRLIYSSDSVAQISLDCGFSNEYYINSVFTKHMGMTPGQYRRINRKTLDSSK